MQESLEELQPSRSEQVYCIHCGRRINPSLDRGRLIWSHEFSASEPTECKAEPDKAMVAKLLPEYATPVSH